MRLAGLWICETTDDDDSFAAVIDRTTPIQPVVHDFFFVCVRLPFGNFFLFLSEPRSARALIPLLNEHILSGLRSLVWWMCLILCVLFAFCVERQTLEGEDDNEISGP